MQIAVLFMDRYIYAVYHSGVANMTASPVGCILAVPAEYTRRARYGVYESSRVQFTLQPTFAARAQLVASGSAVRRTLLLDFGISTAQTRRVQQKYVCGLLLGG